MPYISYFLQNMSELQNKIVRVNQYSPKHPLYPKHPITDLELIKLYTYFQCVKYYYEKFFEHKEEELIQLAKEQNIEKWNFEYMELLIIHRPQYYFKNDPTYEDLMNERRKLNEKLHNHVAVMIDLCNKKLPTATIKSEDGKEIVVNAAEITTKPTLRAEAFIDVLFWKLRMFE